MKRCNESLKVCISFHKSCLSIQRRCLITKISLLSPTSSSKCFHHRQMECQSDIIKLGHDIIKVEGVVTSPKGFQMIIILNHHQDEQRPSRTCNANLEASCHLKDELALQANILASEVIDQGPEARGGSYHPCQVLIKVNAPQRCSSIVHQLLCVIKESGQMPSMKCFRSITSPLKGYWLYLEYYLIHTQGLK